MARTTDNYNLNLIDGTDAVENYRVKFNENMEIIDENMGGGGGASALEDLTDVNITSPTDGQVLKYDAENDEWVNGEGGGTGDVADVEVNGSSVVDPISKVAEITSYEEVTLAEYEAIPVAERESNGIAYFIKDLNDESVQGYPPLIYSLEEREIGVWADGKPLYQKTWEFDSSLTVTSNTWTNSPIKVSDFNFENIVSVIGFNVDGTFFGFLGANHDQTFVQIIQTRNTQITLKNVTFQYTKTTDVAGSGIWNGQGGIAHHYSTNETVVGTWIDGKTLYEKTIDCGALPNGQSKDITTPSGMKYLVNAEGFAYNTNDLGYQRLVPFPAGGTNDIRVDLQDGIIRIVTFANWDGYNAYLTIQYTKTS